MGAARSFSSVVGMNENHARVCTSGEWAAYLQGEVLASLAGLADLGDEMLEIGPGPGAATGWLGDRVRRLTAVEIDDAAAALLTARHRDSNVTVVIGDAASLDFPADSFDSVGAFTMLHHVPDRGTQAAILAEALRVLRPGGFLVGSDSLASDGLHQFHAGDTYNPVDPGWLLARLQDTGFSPITVIVDGDLRFVARNPARPGRMS